MKFIIETIFVAILGFFLELFLPWWSVAIAAFLGGLIFNSHSDFLAGFAGIALLWVLKALLIETWAETEFVSRVAEIFSLNKPLIFVVTAITGGLVGGFGAMTGAAVHKKRRRSSSYYKF